MADKDRRVKFSRYWACKSLSEGESLVPENVRKLIGNLGSVKEILFSCCGELSVSKKKLGQTQNAVQVVGEWWILAIREESRFNYVFEIIEPSGSRVYEKKIGEDFKYCINVEKNNIDWLIQSDSFP